MTKVAFQQLSLAKRVAEAVKTFGFMWFTESLDNFRYGPSIKVNCLALIRRGRAHAGKRYIFMLIPDAY